MRHIFWVSPNLVVLNRWSQQVAAILKHKTLELKRAKALKSMFKLLRIYQNHVGCRSETKRDYTFALSSLHLRRPYVANAN